MLCGTGATRHRPAGHPIWGIERAQVHGVSCEGELPDASLGVFVAPEICTAGDGK
jgi:hypothetical protein